MLGAIVAKRLGGLLFLDTIGTAFAALAAGPWLGASVGVATNTLIHLTPGYEYYLNYGIVNVFLGFFWGYWGASPLRIFRVRNGYASLLLSILSCGLIGGALASLIATVTTFEYRLVLRGFDTASLRQWHPADEYYRWLIDKGFVDQNGGIWQILVRDVIAVIPDKVVSVGLSAVILFYFFPSIYRSMAGRSYKDIVPGRRGEAIGFLVPYLATFIMIAGAGHVTMATKEPVVSHRTIIPAEVVAWSIPLIASLVTVVRGRSRPSILQCANACTVSNQSVVWIVYRDVLTILAALLSVAFALKPASISPAPDGPISKIATILSEGWGVLGFIGVFGFLPIFVMRLAGVDPDLKK